MPLRFARSMCLGGAVEFRPALACFRFCCRLAGHAQARPGQRVQALGRNRFFAAFTKSVAALLDPGQREPNLVNQTRLLVQRLNRHVTVRARPDLIERVCRRLDFESFPVAGEPEQVFELGLQSRLATSDSRVDAGNFRIHGHSVLKPQG